MDGVGNTVATFGSVVELRRFDNLLAAVFLWRAHIQKKPAGAAQVITDVVPAEPYRRITWAKGIIGRGKLVDVLGQPVAFLGLFFPAAVKELEVGVTGHGEGPKNMGPVLTGAFVTTVSLNRY